MRRIGFVLGIITGVTLSLLLALTAMYIMVASHPPGSPILLLGIFIPGLIFIISLIISWRWELIGGILWILEGIFLSLMSETPYTFLIPVPITIPLFIAGLLFITSWLISQSEKPKIL